ncbi:MAG: phospho-N-acetylmuramoyl-pentapeptide-transferase [Oscillospiraceae bacterium]|nr:phospho-N-acetylmuramoyl-pentapeptide-transferase [Oscillospiraceae bacterium]
MYLHSVAAFLISLVVSICAGKYIVPALRRAKAEQMIREDGPVWHAKKQGTPTLGGFIFITGTIVACGVAGWGQLWTGDFSIVYMMLFSLVYAAIGFYDDFVALKNKRNLGLRGIHKFALQLIAAAVFILLMRLSGNMTTSVYIPFVNVSLSIPEPVYYVFMAFVAVGTVNAVNLTDGVDGLATGVSIPVAMCFAAVAMIWAYASLGVFSASLAGGLVAFLLFNFHPAKIFMGDTGALFLGGAVCAMAFASDMPLVLVPLGIIYLVEALSDIIQVSYFKLSHGKRVFKMAPLHHHFELCGWGEVKLFVVFTAISAAFAVISYFGVRHRFM